MLLNEEGTKGIVYVTQPYMNLNEAAVLRDQIDDILTQDTGLEGTESSKLTGGLPVSLDINEGIHSSQNLTTIVTMIILTLVLSVVFRSIRLGIITMVPVAVVILWQPLLMNSPDVNVNIFTAMIGTIVFGIGVDDSIHVMHRIQEEGETPTGIANSIEETGQTIFETTITTVSGIGAGFLVTFPGLENFFMIMCLLIIFAFVTSTFLMPAVITSEKVVKAAIKGEPYWVDYGEGIALASENISDETNGRCVRKLVEGVGSKALSVTFGGCIQPRSYLFLDAHNLNGTTWTCSCAVARFSDHVETSVLQLHRITHISFVSIALTKLSLISLSVRHMRYGEGTFLESNSVSSPPTPSNIGRF